MSSSIDRRGVLSLGLACGAALLCGKARAHEIITSTLRVTHPWSRATAPGATSAVLCMKFDEVAEADRLVLAESPVASGAEMGGAGAGPRVDFAIPAGQETYLEEARTHVRLVGLKFPLEVGRSYPLVLGFEKGGVYNTTFSVDQVRLP
jgi:copper(I)-binding protein